MQIVFVVDHEIIIGESKWLIWVKGDAQGSVDEELWSNLWCWKSGYLLASFQAQGETIFLDCNKTWILILNNAFASCGVLMKFSLFFPGHSIMSKITLKKTKTKQYFYFPNGSEILIFLLIFFSFFFFFFLFTSLLHSKKHIILETL